MGIFNNLTGKKFEEVTTSIVMDNKEDAAEVEARADAAGKLEAIDKAQAVIEFNLDGSIIGANSNFLNTVGYSLAEIEGQHHSIFVEPDYKNSVDYREFWAKLNRGEYDAGEYKRLGKGGKEVWIQASYNPIHDANGNVYKVVKFATDITAAKLQSVIDAQNGKVKAALDVVTSNVMMADENNDIVYANKSVLEMLAVAESDIRKELPAFSSATVLGSNVDIFHKNPAHQKSMLSALKETYRTNITVGGRTFALIASPVFGKDNERLSTVVEWSDITAKLAHEEEERAREEQEKVAAAENGRIKQALDVVSSNVMMADAENIIIYANDAVMNMLRVAEADIRKVLPNFSSNNIIGNSVDVFHKNPAHQKSMLSALESTYRTEIKVGVRTFSLIATPVKDESGTRIGTVVEWKDRTDELSFEDVVEGLITSAIDGNLVNRVDIEGRDGFIAKVGIGINKLLALFERTVSEIGESSTSVKSASSEISSGNANLSQRTEEQAASLEETSAAMEEITTTVQQNAANAVQANTLARGAREAAENGGEVVGNAVSAMQAISESSNKINDIIGVIDEIAFQTNLLALNAAVEAARAGDQGRGFAVVADEVRSLAGRSATAAKEIKELIKDSGEKVQEGSDLVNKSGETLEDIVNAVKKVNDIVAEISTASDEQATGLDEVNKAIGEMDEMTQQNAALVEQAAAASESLLDQASGLDELVSTFETSAEAKALVKSQGGGSAPTRSPVAAPKVAKASAKVKPSSDNNDADWSEF